MDGSQFLVVVDSFSKCLEILKCREPTSTVTMNFLHELFRRYGLPKKLFLIIQVSSLQVKFYEAFTIKHITTPEYQSKDQVERFVDTFKRTVK